MVCRRLALLLLLYVSLDFANPLMPGAVTFDPAGSVDGLRAPRVRVAAPAAVAAPARLEPADAERPVLRMPRPVGEGRDLDLRARPRVSVQPADADVGEDH
jgi:hypothetical protein